MLTGLSFGETEEFVSAYDPDKDNPTVFILGVIDLNIMASIEDELTSFRFNPANPTGTADSTLRINQRNLEIIRFALKGVRNFVDAKGNEIPFKTKKVNRFGKTYEVVADEFLNRIPKKVIDELADHILNANLPSEEELKN